MELIVLSISGSLALLISEMLGPITRIYGKSLNRTLASSNAEGGERQLCGNSRRLSQRLEVTEFGRSTPD